MWTAVQGFRLIFRPSWPKNALDPCYLGKVWSKGNPRQEVFGSFAVSVFFEC